MIFGKWLCACGCVRVLQPSEWLVTIQRRSSTRQGGQGGAGKRSREKGEGERRRRLTCLSARLPFSPVPSLAPLVFLSAVCHTVLLSRVTHLPIYWTVYLSCPPPLCPAPSFLPPYVSLSSLCDPLPPAVFILL